MTHRSAACPKGITPPRVRFVPNLDWNSEAYDHSQVPRDARLVVRFIVDTAGLVDRRSITVRANDFPTGPYFEGFVAAYLNAVAGTRYDPARAGKRAVPVVMEQVLRMEILRGGRVHGLPVGRDF